MTIAERFNRRIRTVRTYAAQGVSPVDRAKLAYAGIARHRPFGDESLYARCGRAIAASVAPRIRLAGGARVDLDLTDFSSLIVFEEIFIEQVYPLDEVPFVPELIIDAGAYAGFFTLFAHARFPEAALIAIEPLAENHERARRHFSANQINARCYCAAVGIAAGKAWFVGGGFGGHLSATATAESIEVPVLALKDILAANPVQRLLLKIDIEGIEREVLPSIAGLLPRLTVIFVETHHSESVCREFLAPLLSAGFSHRVIRRRAAEPPLEQYVERVLVRNVIDRTPAYPANP